MTSRECQCAVGMVDRKPGGGWEGVFISCSTFMRTFTVRVSAVTKLEGNVYVFFAGDMGRVALINRRCGKSLSRGSPVLWKKSLFKYPSRLATSECCNVLSVFRKLLLPQFLVPLLKSSGLSWVC